MKTNQVLIRDGLDLQRTKDGYFSANVLLDTWNENNKHDQKSLDFYKRQKGYKEFLLYLKEEEGIEDPVKVGRGRNAQTWIHPLVFVDFAIYISVELRVKAYKYIVDGKEFYRPQAGDYYIEMCNAISEHYIAEKNKKPSQFVFMNEAKIIKKLLGLEKNRNELSSDQLVSLITMQKFNAKLHNNGVGKDSRIKQLSQLAEALIQ